MSDAGRIQRAARFLFEERQAQRRYGPLPDTLAPRTVDEAYAVQDALHTRLAGMLGPVAAAMAAFELFDDRLADSSKRSALALALIADDVGNAGMVFGPPVSDWRKLDLAAAHGQLAINGEMIGEGRGDGLRTG